MRYQVLGIDIETGADCTRPSAIWLRLAVGEGLLDLGDIRSSAI